MPPTRAQRDAFALCGAKTKTGAPCRMFAGQGTDHVGVGRCFKHGGCSPSHRKAAAAFELQQRLHSLAEPLSDEEAQPHHVLKQLLRQTGGRLQWLDRELASGETSAAVQRMFKEERQFLAWISKMCSEAKVEEVEANVKQAQAEHMAALIRQAAADAGLDALQVNALGMGLRMRVAETSGDTAKAEAEARELAKLRERIDAEREQRIADAARAEAERLSGLTLPPAEWLPEDPAPAA